MFEATVKQGVLDEVFDVADALVEEAVLQFDEDGMSMRVVDMAGVGMADVTVPASDFQTYETDFVRMGVNINRMANVLGMASGADELVEFELDDETRKLTIQVNDIEYTMALIAPDHIEGMDEFPDLPFGAVATVATAEVKRAITAADMVSDHVKVEIEDGTFRICASGDDDDSDYEPSDVQVAAGKTGEVEDVSALYSLEYLKDMSKSVSSSYVRISVADDQPASIAFALNNGDGEGEFLLAPRINSQ